MLIPQPPVSPTAGVRHRLIALLCGGLMALFSSAPLRAHPGGLQNPLKCEIAADKLIVTVWVSVTELGVLGGVEIDKLTGKVDMAALEDAAPRHDRYLLSHLSFRADDALLNGSVQQIIPPESIGQGPVAPDNAHYRYLIHYPVPQVPERLLFSHNVGTDAVADDGTPWNVTYNIQIGLEGQPLTPARLQPGAEFIFLPVKGKIEFEPEVAPLPRRMLPELADASARSGVADGIRNPALLAMALACLLVSAGAVDFLRRWSLLAAGAAGGYFLAVHLGDSLPGWLPGPVAGLAAILAGADLVHDFASPPGFRRRFIFVLGGLGLGLGLTKHGLSLVRGNETAFSLPGSAAYLAGGIAVATVVGMLLAEAWQRSRPAGETARRVTVQLCGLVVIMAGALHILRTLHIVAW